MVETVLLSENFFSQVAFEFQSIWVSTGNSDCLFIRYIYTLIVKSPTVFRNPFQFTKFMKHYIFIYQLFDTENSMAISISNDMIKQKKEKKESVHLWLFIESLILPCFRNFFFWNIPGTCRTRKRRRKYWAHMTTTFRCK